MGNMLIRSRCHNLQMSFCLKIAILFCEGGKEGAKEGVTSLLCTATSSSKHRLKWVQTSSQIATAATTVWHSSLYRVKLIINKQGGDDVLSSPLCSQLGLIICIWVSTTEFGLVLASHVSTTKLNVFECIPESRVASSGP